jgi:hypothetical protein
MTRKSKAASPLRQRATRALKIAVWARDKSNNSNNIADTGADAPTGVYSRPPRHRHNDA